MSPQERELVEHMRDDAALNGDYAGAAELDALLHPTDPASVPREPEPVADSSQSG